MDPRLHPSLNPAVPSPAPSPPQQPTPPQPPAAPAPAPTPIPPPPVIPTHQPPPQAEVVESIPVHQPGETVQAPVAAAPVIQMPSSPTLQQEPQDDLERILQAVNNRVAGPMQASPAKPKNEIVKKLAAKAAKAKTAGKSSKPIGPMAVAVAIALILCALAFFAYRKSGSATPLSNQPGKVGTSYTASDAIQSAGGTLVRPSDLDDYSQELQTKLNSLNDSQDFATQPLTDQVLGL